jgi:hypothetical protein
MAQSIADARPPSDNADSNTDKESGNPDFAYSPEIQRGPVRQIANRHYPSGQTGDILFERPGRQ